MSSGTPEYDYDIAVTFAGEDRALVHQIVDQVKEAGFRVFYDEDEQVALWGEDLVEFFPDLYERRSRFAVMFISTDYAAKPWTRLERRSVLLRAMNQDSPYLLPVRIDHIDLPGVRSSISYLDANALGSEGIARAIQTKLGHPGLETASRFNGLVPRTEKEATILLGERPAGWEYLFFSYLLVREFQLLNDRYMDYQIGFAEPSDFVSDDELIKRANRDNARTRKNALNFMSVLSPEAQVAAFGAPGEAGNPEVIAHLARRLASVYGEFMSWGMHLRGCTTESDEAHEVLLAMAHFSDQPIKRLHDFPNEFREHLDKLTVAVQRQEPFNLSLELPLEITEAANDAFDKALGKFRRHRER